MNLIDAARSHAGCWSAHSFDSDLAGGFLPLTPDTRRVADVAALQADGKIVVAGHTIPDPDHAAVTLIRYNTDGSIDGNFNGGKPVVVDPTAINDLPQAMAIQSDGRIDLLIRSQTDFTDGTQPFLILRFNADGTLDTSYGNHGSVTVTGLFTDTHPTLLVSGNDVQLAGSGDGSLKVEQFDASGKLDSSFGDKGVTIINDGDSDDLLAAASLGGKILLLGESTHGTDQKILSQQLVLATLLPSGKIDATGVRHAPLPLANFYLDSRPAAFDGSRFLLPIFRPTNGIVAIHTDGTVDTSFGKKGIASIADPFIVDPGKRIVSVANSFYDTDENGETALTPGVVSVYTAHAKPDTSFNHKGTATFSIPDSDLPVTAMLSQADGKVVLIGTSDNPQNFALVRFTAAGSLDSSFGSGGVVRSVPKGADGENTAVAVQSDGKIIVAGDSQTPGSKTETALFQRLQRRWIDRSEFLTRPGAGGSAHSQLHDSERRRDRARRHAWQQ